jgi:hypothetical protein
MKLMPFNEAPLWAYGWYDDVGGVRHYFVKTDVNVMQMWCAPGPDSKSHAHLAVDVVVSAGDAIEVWVQGTTHAGDEVTE